MAVQGANLYILELVIASRHEELMRSAERARLVRRIRRPQEVRATGECDGALTRPKKSPSHAPVDNSSVKRRDRNNFEIGAR